MAEREKILILGGTKEAAELAAELTAAGHDVTTSLAGRTAEPEPVAGKVRIGGFSGEGKSGADASAKLRSANAHGLPSFPSRTPRIELDFVLVSDSIEVTDFRVPDVRFSDHRPVICDFNVVRSTVAADSRQSAA